MIQINHISISKLLTKALIFLLALQYICFELKRLFCIIDLFHFICQLCQYLFDWLIVCLYQVFLSCETYLECYFDVFSTSKLSLCCSLLFFSTFAFFGVISLSLLCSFFFVFFFVVLLKNVFIGEKRKWRKVNKKNVKSFSLFFFFYGRCLVYLKNKAWLYTTVASKKLSKIVLNSVWVKILTQVENIDVKPSSKLLIWKIGEDSSTSCWVLNRAGRFKNDSSSLN